jgi:mannose/fructose/N-acetylgalactosamine-specific phosphotransferase system component IIC
MPFILQILKLSVLAGALGVDATAAFQILLSRPLVAGGLAGWLLGDLGSGLAVGSLVELLWMGGVPVGSVVPPDGTSAAIFAAAASVLLPQWLPGVNPLAAASLGLLVAVPVGSFGAKVEILQRRLTDRLCRWAEARLAEGQTSGIGWALLGGLALGFGRSFLTAGVVLALGLPALAQLLSHLPADVSKALEWGYWLAWLLGLAVGVDYFWERRSLKYLGVMMVLTAFAGARLGFSQLQLLGLALALSLAAGLWRWRRAWLESQEGGA